MDLIGVDTGGTFTDIIRRGSDGRLQIYKRLSTPEDPSRAIGDGVEAVVETDEGEPTPFRLVHGTTVATNALLERGGARLAFVTTAGFEDLLTLQRQNRPELYALDVDRPEPLVSPADSFGVDERLAYDGSELRSVDEEGLEALVDELREGGYEAAAVCLLHAYANDEHEKRVARYLREQLPELDVSTSSEVVGEFREYERASTTCVNAYVAPVMSEYLGRLEDRVEAEDIQVLQSSGGRVDLEHAGAYPVHTVLSGPAGGVVGARAAAGELDIDRLISLDMGGTSTDVSLCDGELEVSSQFEIDGLPIRAPVIDIHTVGAGGGSIAYVDPGGALKVGPRSAGADPGPACYGKGGEEPTVTDAHVVLGRIRPGRFLGGRMSLDVDRAEQAVGELADELDMELEETAHGILEIADAAMNRALKVISLERGHDPREFALVAFGGAGALHACRLADSLDMRRVLVPRNPGLLSAYGMLHADFQRLVTRSVLAPLTDMLEGADRLSDILVEMRDGAIGDQPDPETFGLEWVAQLRYEGQSFELDVPVDWQPDHETFTDPTEAFEAEHERLYGYRAEERDIELVGLRLTASRPGPEPGGYTQMAPDASDEPAERHRAEVGFKSGTHDAEIVDRRALEPGDIVDGPAIVTEYSGTTVVPPEWRGENRAGHLLFEKTD
jgi:N-methylhydantoinase A